MEPQIDIPLELSKPRRFAVIPLFACLLCVALAGGLRWWAFPQRNEFRDVDETNYTLAGLTLFEGTPTATAAPGGPEHWITWTACALKSAGYVVRPTPEERAVSLAVRPFVAANHALFDLYRDASALHAVIVGANLLVALWATLAAFRIGNARAGWAGGVLFGGLVAALPIFIAFSNMARPYSMAWSFSIIALDFASLSRGRFRATLAGLFMGLAVASRVDMLSFAPIVFWQFWDRPEPRRLWRSGLRLAIITLAVALIVAPWFATNLIENLRTIATVRFFPVRRVPLAETLKELGWKQGLAAVLLLLPTAVFLAPRGARLKTAALGLFTLILLISAFKGSGFGLHQQAAAILALLAIAPIGLANLARRSPRIVGTAVGIALALPLVQGTVQAARARRYSVNDQSVAWIEKHVPPGTRVFLASSGLQTPLPTPQAADLAWANANAPELAKAKFEAGLRRMNLSADEVPRAFSEANVLAERWVPRRLYILGSRATEAFPRFDIVESSYTGGDLKTRFLQEGGVFVTREPDPDRLGQPFIQWAKPDAATEHYFWYVYVYVSPDLRGKLLADPS